MTGRADHHTPNAAVENAAAAVLYIAVYDDGLVPLESALDILLPHLPFRSDRQEALDVYEELCKLIDCSSPASLVPPRLSQILGAFAETVVAYCENDDDGGGDDDEETEDDHTGEVVDIIVATVQSARRRLGYDVDAALQLMKPEQRHAYADAFER